MKKVAHALYDFLARNDVPDRDQVKIIVQFPNKRSQAHAEMAFRHEISPYDGVRMDWNSPKREIEGIKFEFKV